MAFLGWIILILGSLFITKILHLQGTSKLGAALEFLFSTIACYMAYVDYTRFTSPSETGFFAKATMAITGCVSLYFFLAFFGLV
jgi:hypothetical protein